MSTPSTQKKKRGGKGKSISRGPSSGQKGGGPSFSRSLQRRVDQGSITRPYGALLYLAYLDETTLEKAASPIGK